MEFRVFVPGARRVQLVGSFTQWQTHPVSMRHQGGGWWVFRAEIKQGDHEFFYTIDGWRRLPDYAAHGVRCDEQGRWISGLYVPAAAACATDELLAA